MTKDEALRLALEALELMYACYAHPDWVSHKQQEEKILAQCVATTMTLRQAIKAALEAKDERVVNTDHVICPNCVHQFRAIPQNVQKLMLASGFEPPFTTPPQRTWVGLTDEEKKSFWTADQMTQEEWDELFSAIEAKLKDKNNA